MLDTIRLRLYGVNDLKRGTLSTIQSENGKSPFAVPEHHELFKKMVAFKGRDFSMTVHYSQEKETWEHTDPDSIHVHENVPRLTNHWQIKERMRFIEEGKAKDIIKGIPGKYRIPSSFSDATFFINTNAGYIDFEVSIPKYLYGHSLAQFIPQEDSELKFEHGQQFNNWEFQVKHLYPRLRKFIDKFLTDLCNQFNVECYPNEKYVEIRRLDLCYNMYFQSKEESLKVLRELQKIDKKRRKSKLNGNLQAGFETTHAYKSSVGAYYKIYHKGTEYSESQFGDLKKHLEVNREYMEKMINRFSNPENKKFYGDHMQEIWGKIQADGKGTDYQLSEKNRAKLEAVLDHINKEVPYKVGFLKKEMDKILRYEISLKGAFLSNLYKRKVFRRNDRVHQDAMSKYKRTASVLNNMAKDPTKITRDERRNYKMMHKYLNRGIALIVGDSHSLIMHGEKTIGDFNRASNHYNISKFGYAHTILGKHDTVHFNDYFLRQCASCLKEFIDEYTIDLIPPFEDVMSRIQQYNEEVEEKVALYNEHNKFKLIKPNGERRRKNILVWEEIKHGDRKGEVIKVKKEEGALITTATQMLKATELRKMGMQRINTTVIGSFLTQMYIHNKSLDDCFKLFKTHKSTKSRIRSQLKTFGIYDNSLNVSEGVVMKTTFDTYYWKTSSLAYQNKFYRNPKLIAEDYGINPFDPQDEKSIA